jgi:hypothetical protein
MVKNGRLHSASFAINWFSATIRPINFWTSFLFCGGCIYVMALILLGFALMHFMETKHPSTFPLVTPNMHFSGLSLSQASRMLVKVSARSEM